MKYTLHNGSEGIVVNEAYVSLLFYSLCTVKIDQRLMQLLTKIMKFPVYSMTKIMKFLVYNMMKKVQEKPICFAVETYAVNENKISVYNGKR